MVGVGQLCGDGFYQCWQVFVLFVQCGYFDWEYVEVIEQIFVEFVFGDVCFQIMVGCGYDVYVVVDGLVVIDVFEVVFLQYVQQFYLYGQVYVVDFVEQQGVVFGYFEMVFVCGQCVSKGIFFVVEQFVFQQVGWNGVVVDCYEWIIMVW